MGGSIINGCSGDCFWFLPGRMANAPGGSSLDKLTRESQRLMDRLTDRADNHRLWPLRVSSVCRADRVARIMKGSYGSICAVDLSEELDQSRGLGKTETAGKESETNRRSNRWGTMKRGCQCGTACRSVECRPAAFWIYRLLGGGGGVQSTEYAGQTTYCMPL